MTGSRAVEAAPVNDLTSLLDRIESAAQQSDDIAVGDIVDEIGTRSFSPLLLAAGLVIVAPVIGDLPGVPVLMGAIVIFVSVQLILRRDQVWLPGWIERPTIASKKVERFVNWLRRPAKFVDRWTRPRLEWAVRHAFLYLIAIACIVIGAATPIMEVIPFSANLAGIAICAFALGLFTHDGLVALGAAIFTVAATVLLIVLQIG